jgi:uncharacterized membrane protein
MERTMLAACTTLRQRCLTDYGNWVALTLAASCLGLGSLAYGVSDRFFTSWLPDGAPRHALLAADSIGIALALLVGPWQLVPGLRWRWPQVHGWLVRLYAASTVASALTTVVLACMINAGLTATFGLLALGSVWLATTGLGVLQAWRGNIVAHRRWMTRSLALTMVTTGLRFWFVLSLPFATAYPAVACLG